MKKFLVFVFILGYGSLWGETPIFILHSYHETYPWTKSQRTGFREVLDNVTDLYPLYSAEYLDTKRRNLDQKYEDDFVAYLKSKYKGYHPKLIYVTDDNALKFMLHNKEKLFPSVPVVFSGINDHSKQKRLEASPYTGIYEKKEITPNLKLIKTLFPQEHEVLLIGDGSLTSDVIYQNVERGASAVQGMKIQYANDHSFESVIRTIKAFKGKVLILTTVGGFRAQDGDLLPLREAINQIVKAGPFVVMSLEDSYIQQGVLGGYADDGIVQGASAGALAVQILLHPKSPLPRVIQNTNGWIFDAKVLEQHSIMLPKKIASQSKILNPPETFFQSHHTLIIYLLYGLSATVMLGSLSFGWYMYRSRRREAEAQRIFQRLHLQNQAILEAVPDMILQVDNDKRYTWANNAGMAFFGKEVIGKEASSFFEGEQDTYEIVNPLLEGDETLIYVESWQRRHDGEKRLLAWWCRTLKDENGNVRGILSTARDITEEHEREEALLLQAQIINTVQDSIIVHDSEGKFIYLNENAWKSRGYTREEMMGMSVKELDAPEYTHGNPEEMKGLIEQMEQQGWLRVEVEHMCKNGERLPVEVYAKQITLHDKPYVLSSVRDISERKTAQRALEESEKKYKDLVESAMIGIYRSDLSGNILYVNRALAWMLGFDSPDELIGQKSVLRYNNPKQREEFIQRLFKEHHLSNYELELLDKDRAMVPVMVSAAVDGDVLSGMIIDMREIKHSRIEIEKLSKVVEQIDDSVIITDKFGVITYANEASFHHTGYSKEDILGKTPRMFKSGMHEQEFYQELWRIILNGEVFRGTLINRKKNGDLYYENKTITPLKDEKDNLVGFVSSGKDVTEEALLHQEIERIATIDKLTGIYNRHKFEELFAMETERFHRFSLPLSMILIDIDHFKSVNDTYGHDVGDEVLKHLTNTIQENIRKIDIFARWGGEEFLVLSPGTDVKEIRKFAEKLRLAIDGTTFPEIGHVTISLGISTFKNHDTFSELFKRADQGLYYAKDHGRNRVGYIEK